MFSYRLEWQKVPDQPSSLGKSRRKPKKSKSSTSSKITHTGLLQIFGKATVTFTVEKNEAGFIKVKCMDEKNPPVARSVEELVELLQKEGLV